jgi:hypothetical protein
MLERNKYARHEPSGSTSNNLSQSIELLSVTASEGGAISGSTYWTGFVPSLSGSVAYTSSQNQELYTGQFSGSTITATDSTTFNNQWEISSIQASQSYYVTYSLGALYNNVTGSVTSQFAVDLDYNSDQIKPVNYGLVTRSLDLAQTNSYDAYTNPVNDFAQLQDYNYFLRRSIIPRYEGSQVQSRYYNSWSFDDNSYGKTAAIDKVKYQYAYLVDIYTSSLFFPGRSNSQIKYLIDNSENVLDLTKANTNIFSVQNVFKSQETADVSLFIYDEKNPYSQKLANNSTLQIYEGGFRYVPIYHNLSGSSNMIQSFTLNSPDSITINTPGGGGSGSLDPNNPVFNTANWSLSYSWLETQIDASNSYYTQVVTATYSGGASPYDVLVNISTYMQSDLSCGSVRTISTVVYATQTNGSVNIGTGIGPYTGGGSGTGYAPGFSSCFPIDTISNISQFGGGGGGGGSSTSTFYTSQVTGSTPCLYYISQSNQIVFNSAIAYYYNTFGMTYNSTSDTAWSGSGLERVVLPLTIELGDKVSLYDSASALGWDERFEYTVKSVSVTGSGLTNSRLLVEVDRPVNLSLLSTGSFSDSLTGAAWRGCRYIVWKHIPDETNVILRYNPVDPTLTEEGILFPQYIDPLVKANSGNVIKALKQQNLI